MAEVTNFGEIWVASPDPGRPALTLDLNHG